MKNSRNWIMLAVGCVLAGMMMGCESGANSGTSDVSITPASVYLTAGKVNVVNLGASGGDSNYTWAVENTTLGAIFGAGAVAVYESTTNAGVNTVIVSDGSSNTASCVITQQ
jgi:hypothetical protein